MCDYLMYIQSYKGLFDGYPKRTFAQVLYMCCKPRIQKFCIRGIRKGINKMFQMAYHMWNQHKYLHSYSVFFEGYHF
jgi:hypothetical protein